MSCGSQQAPIIFCDMAAHVMLEVDVALVLDVGVLHSDTSTAYTTLFYKLERGS